MPSRHHFLPSSHREGDRRESTNRRREYLASIATLVTTCGCLGSGSEVTTTKTGKTADSPPDQKATGTHQTTETSTAAGSTEGTPTEGTASPRDADVREFGTGEIIEPADAVALSTGLVFDTPDALRVVNANEWFVLVQVSVSTYSYDPSRFSLVTDDETRQSNPGLYESNYGWWDGSPIETGEPLEIDEPNWLVFELPQLGENSQPRLRFADGSDIIEWPLPSETVARLRDDPPEFTLSSVTVPDSVRPDESIEISVTVRNLGSVLGYFFGTFNEQTQYTVHPLSVRLDPSEERTTQLSLPNRADSGVDQVDYDFVSTVREQQYTVEIDRSTTS